MCQYILSRCIYIYYVYLLICTITVRIDNILHGTIDTVYVYGVLRCIYDIYLTRLICVSNLCSGSRFDILYLMCFHVSELMLPRLWGRGPWKPRWHEFCKHAAWLNCFTPKLGLRMVGGGDVWEDDGKALET